MMTMEVDFEVWQTLTLKRRGESDTYNDVLRRLLKLKPADALASEPSGERPWEPKGVTLPHGTDLQLTHKGRTYSAKVIDGTMVYNDTTYATPSAAAIDITKTNVNGWRVWFARLPGHTDWQSLDSLRASSRRKSA